MTSSAECGVLNFYLYAESRNIFFFIHVHIKFKILHSCFKSYIAAIKHFFISVRKSGTSLASKCKHGSSLDISFLSVTRIL